MLINGTLRTLIIALIFRVKTLQSVNVNFSFSFFFKFSLKALVGSKSVLGSLHFPEMNVPSVPHVFYRRRGNSLARFEVAKYK